jgi:hypothetical protein
MVMISKIRIVFSLLLMLGWVLLSSVAAGQVYQWRDASGNVHFGDAPPEGVEADAIDLPPGPSPEQVEAAQQRLEAALKASPESSQAPVETPEVDYPSASGPLPAPEFACYAPLENVLNGPVLGAYEAISPTQATDQQRLRVEALLARVAGTRVGSAVELVCSGTVDEPRARQLEWDVRSIATWQAQDGLLILENDGLSRELRESKIRTTYLMISDALYFFESDSITRNSADRTIDLPGNAVEGLFLDEYNLAFKIKVRSFNARTGSSIVRTELRLLTVDDDALTFSELFFHGNLLTGSRVWQLR